MTMLRALEYLLLIMAVVFLGGGALAAIMVIVYAIFGNENCDDREWDE